MSVSQFATPMVFALEAKSGLTSKGEALALSTGTFAGWFQKYPAP